MTNAERVAEPLWAPLRTLSEVLGSLRDGVIILDHRRCVALANPAARDRLGMPAGAPPALGTPFVTPPHVDAVEVEFDVAGEPFTAVILQNQNGDTAIEQRRLLAFARTAARAACMGSLQSTLDALAADVLDVTAAVTCTVIVTDPRTAAISVIGTAADPREHLVALEEAQRRGAPLITLTAAKDRRPRVQRNLRRLVENDNRFAPLAPIVEEGRWDSLVAAPLVMRDVTLGALTAYYSASHDPDQAEVAFIATMADQAAVAVNTALLFSDVEGKAMLEERHRLARDLHDSVAQNLYSLVLQTRAAEAAASRGGNITALVERLATVRTLAEAALADTRSAITELRAPTSAGDSGLAATVREHAATVAQREGVAVRVSVPPEPLLLSVAAEQELYWLIAEALTNSTRHARATSVEIDIAAPSDRDELSVTIRDDGIGFDPSENKPGHVGLESMRERTARLGGRLTLHSSSDGTVICAVVPYRRWPRGLYDHK